MKGKFISIFLTVSILCSLCSIVSADPDCKVTVNGKEPAYAQNEKPFMKDDEIMLPVKCITEALGGTYTEIELDDGTTGVSATVENNALILMVGSEFYGTTKVTETNDITRYSDSDLKAYSSEFPTEKINGVVFFPLVRYCASLSIGIFIKDGNFDLKVVSVLGYQPPIQSSATEEPKPTVKPTPVPTEQPVDKSVIRVLLNGQRITFDVDPVIINDRTMVPLRAIGEALQAKVDWEEATETITITKGDVVNTLKLGDVNAYKTVNGKQETIVLETAPFTKNDRTLVPLRYLSESFDMEVEWVEEENMVRITSKDLPTPKPSPTASPKPTATPKPTAKPTPTPVPTPKSLQGTGKAMKSIDFSKDTKGEMLELHCNARYAFEQYNLPELMFMNVDDVYDAYFTAQRAISSFINDIWNLTSQVVFQNSNSLEMREAFSGTTSQSQRDSITQKYQRENKLLASDCYRITYESGNGLYAIILDMADIDTMPIGSFIGIVFDNQGNMMYYVLEQSTDGIYILCGRDKNGEHLNYGILEHSREAFVNAILKRES